MKLATEYYSTQVSNWPKTGRSILAQFDDNSVVVYQAFRPSIGHFAAAQGYFGGEFSFSRMSWIKPNFLWMMYRSGWGSKKDQEVVLAIWIQRSAFETILAEAVYSTFEPEVYASEAEWKKAVARSSVRLQWDPDHNPSGGKLQRRAIQLGLRGEILAQYARDWIVDIENISEFVQQQRQYLEFSSWSSLITPLEITYPVQDFDTAKKLGLSLIKSKDGNNLMI